MYVICIRLAPATKQPDHSKKAGFEKQTRFSLWWWFDPSADHVPWPVAVSKNYSKDKTC